MRSVVHEKIVQIAFLAAIFAFFKFGFADAAGSAPAAAHDMAGMEMRASSGDASTSDPGAMGEMSHDMAMSPHMAMTDLRHSNDADQERAQRIVDTLKASIAKYKDYRLAERDGFKPFLPQLKLKEYHFANYWNGFKAAFEFDPAAPTSLLYKPTSDGGYQLVGAMYTMPKGAGEDKLDARVPLSVARWHRHVDLCFPPKGKGTTADWTRFGFAGSISTKQACDAAGGRFYPQVFGWMVHVYPWRTDPSSVWAH